MVALGAAAIFIAAGAVTCLTILRPTLSLSVTRDLDTWLPATPGTGGRCAMTRTRSGFGKDGLSYMFDPLNCRGPVDPRRLFVVGDSHAQAYQRMVGNVTRSLGMPAKVYTRSGCTVLPGADLPTAPERRDCAEEVSLGLSTAAAQAKSGDILFLPGLRIARYREYWETSPRAPGIAKRYTAAMIDAEAARLRSFLDRGVRVIIEAPPPVYAYAPMRCGDWFNAHNPHCETAPIPVADERSRRAAAMQIIEAVRARAPGIEIWDPFPLLCPGTACSAVMGGKPIVSDGDHFTGYANDYLTPSFRSAVERR